jgi:hypothetical protein
MYLYSTTVVHTAVCTHKSTATCTSTAVCVCVHKYTVICVYTHRAVHGYRKVNFVLCVHTAVVPKFSMDLVLNRRLASRAVRTVNLASG